MTKRRVRRTRTARKLPQKQVGVEEPLELDVIEGEKAVEAKPARKTRTRRKPSASTPEEVAKTEPVRKVRARRKPAKPPTPHAEGEPDASVASEPDDAKIGTVVRSEFAKALFEVVDAGQVLILKRVGNKIIVYKAQPEGITAPAAKPVAIAKKRVISVKAMREFAYSEDYAELQEWWPQLSFEDKVAECEESGIEWEEHDDPMINAMRLSVAYMKAMEISKWKPEYKAKSARDALLVNGLPTE